MSLQLSPRLPHHQLKDFTWAQCARAHTHTHMNLRSTRSSILFHVLTHDTCHLYSVTTLSNPTGVHLTINTITVTLTLHVWNAVELPLVADTPSRSATRPSTVSQLLATRHYSVTSHAVPYTSTPTSSVPCFHSATWRPESNTFFFLGHSVHQFSGCRPLVLFPSAFPASVVFINCIMSLDMIKIS